MPFTIPYYTKTNCQIHGPFKYSTIALSFCCLFWGDFFFCPTFGVELQNRFNLYLVTYLKMFYSSGWKNCDFTFLHDLILACYIEENKWEDNKGYKYILIWKMNFGPFSFFFFHFLFFLQFDIIYWFVMWEFHIMHPKSTHFQVPLYLLITIAASSQIFLLIKTKPKQYSQTR